MGTQLSGRVSAYCVGGTRFKSEQNQVFVLFSLFFSCFVFFSLFHCLNHILNYGHMLQKVVHILLFGIIKVDSWLKLHVILQYSRIWSLFMDVSLNQDFLSTVYRTLEFQSIFRNCYFDVDLVSATDDIYFTRHGQKVWPMDFYF